MKSKLQTLGVVAGVSLLSTLSASAATYSNDFNVADNTTNFGGGVTSQGNNPGGGFTSGGQLRLTTSGVGSTYASLSIPAMAGSSLGWTASFRYTLIANGGFEPADGLSFNYGNVPLGLTNGGGNPEEGWNVGGGETYIAAMVDTWQNNNAGDLPDVGIASNIGGVNSILADQDGNVIEVGQTLSGTMSISYDPTNGMSFSTTGLANNAAFSNVALPGFTGNDAYNFVLAARTGGATQDFLIDDLVITTVPEASTTLLAALAGLGLLNVRRRK